MSIEDEMRALTSYEEEIYGDPWEKIKIEPFDENKAKLSNLKIGNPANEILEITLRIRGQMNNLTVAAAIYEAFTTCRDPIDLYEVANMLQAQIRAEWNMPVSSGE